jgi:hypothetical protein
MEQPVQRAVPWDSPLLANLGYDYLYFKYFRG